MPSCCRHCPRTHTPQVCTPRQKRTLAARTADNAAAAAAAAKVEEIVCCLLNSDSSRVVCQGWCEKKASSCTGVAFPRCSNSWGSKNCRQINNLDLVRMLKLIFGVGKGSWEGGVMGDGGRGRGSTFCDTINTGLRGQGRSPAS